MEIRRAREDEAATLSAIARASKAHWPYSPAQIEAWLPDLRISAEQIAAHPSFAAEVDGVTAGFYQLLTQPGTWVLEHLWVVPAYMGKGVGRALLQHAMKFAHDHGAERISIDADPYAEAFYIACGATIVERKIAPIPDMPQRVRPQMALIL